MGAFADIGARLIERSYCVGRDLLAGEREMVRQAAAIMLRAEQLQAGLVKGEPVNPDELIRLSSEARRALRIIKASAMKPEALPTPLPWSPLRAALAKAAAIGRGDYSAPKTKEVAE
jgi:hypothetical protein